MKIRLKSIQHSAFASQETHCYTANLWIDGKKVGTVSNDGHGGCDRFHGDREKYDEADKWCKANLPKWSLSAESTDPHDTDLEMHCGDLVNTWLVTRDLKKALKTKIVFRKPEDGQIYELKHKNKIEAALAAVQRDHPSAEILNTMPLDAALAIYRSI